MGSLRRGLILALLPSSALAEVCEKIRPDWDGTSRTAVTEALFLATTPTVLFLLAATTTALVLRNQWGGLVACVMWSFALMFVIAPDTSGIAGQAIAEGCKGHPWLFMILAVALCVGTVLWTMPRKET